MLAVIRRDIGREFLAVLIMETVEKNRTTTLNIQPGNASNTLVSKDSIEPARHEWLDLHQFESVKHAQLQVSSIFGVTAANGLAQLIAAFRQVD